MTDREILQEILATYLVFQEEPLYLTKTLGLLFCRYLRKYLVISKRINEKGGWNWLNSHLRSNERFKFFTLLRIAHLKE